MTLCRLAMGKVIEFNKNGRQTGRRGNTLCREGHHKWVIIKQRQFDVKQGKLVTAYRCQRCGKQKVKAL